MALLRELYLRVRWLAGQSRFQAELADEIQFHIESRADELESAGVPRAQALLRARREFGSPLKAAEDTSGAWRIAWLADLASDLRYAARAFRRNPGFALTAICCLALRPHDVSTLRMNPYPVPSLLASLAVDLGASA
jgi:hypothetical protein